ncbi:MAG: DUF1553 domain-containing protein [Planctomycetota bacterium]|nr:DUF1553 domain-containing protein [Planctomycetota bacterium]
MKVPRASLWLVPSLCLLAGVLDRTARAEREEPAVDFGRQIRPLLSDRCFPCHGPDEAARLQEGGFRLDRFADATEDLGGYAPIVPGRPDDSEVVYRIRSDDPAERMPPPRSNRSLTREEIELIERWIEEGAEYAEHWSFVPPTRRDAPRVRDGSWPRDELDRFVLARLEAAGLAPAPAADRETWIRRVTFDLTGLPPTPGEVDAFLADEGEDAHEKVVDRLLASPRYAERMTADWLDLARYADTYGYQNDVARRVWPWRDWVIRSFDSNLPYDQFVLHQLAGDLLPDPTRDQRLATTFNRLHRQTNEGGSVEEEYRVEYVSDRVHTFGMAFLGLTFECARCHDHKFDPIAHDDYYGLGAFFDDIDESGLYSHFTSAVPTPTLLLTEPEDDARIAALEERIARAEEALAGLLEPAFDLQGLVGAFSFESIDDGALANAADPEKPGRVADGPRLAPGRFGQGLELSGENNATFPGVGELRRWDPFSLSLWIRVSELTDRAVVLHRSRAWTDAGSCGYQLLLEDGRPSFSLIHFWPGDAIRVRTREGIPAGEWTHVAVTYDGSSRAAGLTLYVDGAPAAVEVVRDHLIGDIVSGGNLVLTLGQRFRDRGFAGGRVDELLVFDRRISAEEVRRLHAGSIEPGAAPEVADSIGAADSIAAADSIVAAAWLAAAEELRALRAELGALVDGIPEIMTMVATPEPREAYVLRRGSYAARGERVEPHTPAAIWPFPDDLPPNRLGLARWLTDPGHPLTARVAVNRLWQLVFGRGLVATPENFGSQGTPPTHPELLDHLALSFVDSGWNVKAMLKRIVLSATYRQSSRPSPEARRVDPSNMLLSRAPSYRMPAEWIRDGVLVASGLLVEQLGGPSVKPYQPAGLWHEKSGQVYQADTGDGLHRRSLYTFWKRTSPPPAMMIFDMGKREVCAARRRTTSTPLQALVLLNDPQYTEAANALAERVLREGGATVDERLTHAFRLLATRRPTAGELDVLRELLEEQRAAFAEHPDEALALLGVSASSADPVELAAYAVVASTLLAYDPVVTKR